MELSDTDVDRLYEESKNDRHMIVGSEIRQLAGGLRRCRIAVNQQSAALREKDQAIAELEQALKLEKEWSEIIDQQSAALRELQDTIRSVVTQRADELCWRDVYAKLSGLVGIEFNPELIVPRECFLANCQNFARSLEEGGPYRPVYVERAGPSASGASLDAKQESTKDQAIAELTDRAERAEGLLVEAVEVLDEARGTFGHGHFDMTQQAGSGCEVCIRQRSVSHKVATLLGRIKNG